MRVLLLGGTTEASQMARALADAGVEAVFSYAGRTANPVAQPLPQRVGGFGGVTGLRTYLADTRITHVIDATHPFAAQMSGNAHAACTAQGVPLIRLERPAWQAQAGDDWHTYDSLEQIAAALPRTPARVFLAIGKQNLHIFAAQPQHHYLLRLVDAPAAALPLPHTTVVLDRGPFDVGGDTALLRDHRITHIVAKNAGGSGAQAKLAAARALRLPVLMAARPALEGAAVASVGEAMAWLGHSADLGV